MLHYTSGTRFVKRFIGLFRKRINVGVVHVILSGTATLCNSL